MTGPDSRQIQYAIASLPTEIQWVLMCSKSSQCRVKAHNKLVPARLPAKRPISYYNKLKYTMTLWLDAAMSQLGSQYSLFPSDFGLVCTMDNLYYEQDMICWLHFYKGQCRSWDVRHMCTRFEIEAHMQACSQISTTTWRAQSNRINLSPNLTQK